MNELEEIRQIMGGPGNFVQISKLQLRELVGCADILKRLVKLREGLRTGQMTDQTWNDARQVLERLGVK